MESYHPNRKLLESHLRNTSTRYFVRAKAWASTLLVLRLQCSSCLRVKRIPAVVRVLKPSGSRLPSRKNDCQSRADHAHSRRHPKPNPLQTCHPWVAKAANAQSFADKHMQQQQQRPSKKFTEGMLGVSGSPRTCAGEGISENPLVKDHR